MKTSTAVPTRCSRALPTRPGSPAQRVDQNDTRKAELQSGAREYLQAECRRRLVNERLRERLVRITEGDVGLMPSLPNSPRLCGSPWTSCAVEYRCR